MRVPVDPARPEDGDRNLSRGGFFSYEAAQAELMLLRADVIRGVPQAIGRDTFAGYAQRWVDGYGGSNGTRLYIQRAVDAMEPYIGHLRLADIRPTDLAAAYRGLFGGPIHDHADQAPRRWHPRRLVPHAEQASWLRAHRWDEGIVRAVLARLVVLGLLSLLLALRRGKPAALPLSGRTDGVDVTAPGEAWSRHSRQPPPAPPASPERTLR